MTEEVTTQTQNIPDKQEELNSILFLLRKLNQLMEKQETKLKKYRRRMPTNRYIITKET